MIRAQTHVICGGGREPYISGGETEAGHRRRNPEGGHRAPSGGSEIPGFREVSQHEKDLTTLAGSSQDGGRSAVAANAFIS